ncbi:ATP-binding protein [Thalassotalea fonticola]|uniref:histidine kinase n=1 Tax=Thalassotalea fonticola TaxID=3065649 RepID=A0ABZ0GPV8_9GAMM|nr:ATP-binding protein [Colwelliaceae bacterium S1-1]
MKLSLYQRLSLALTFVFIAIASVFYLWSEQVGQQSRYLSQQRLHLSLAANLARDNPLLQTGNYDQSALENLFHTLMVLGPAFEFYFIDPSGNILTYSADQSLIKRQQISLVPIFNLIKNQAPLPILGDDPRHTNRQKIFSAAPVFNGDQLKGYLYVIVAGEQYDTVFNSNQLNRQLKMYMVLTVAAILFLFILMLGLFRYVTNPVRQLQHDMQIFIESRFDKSKVNLTRWKNQSNNEVQLVGCMFVQMVEQINFQFDQLTSTDNERRELLAHISHDLRTPLAAMQGYIETLSLNSANLSAAKKIEFMQTVMRNCQQLNQLIDQIFELAHLESGQVSVEQETFNLVELIYDVVAKFSLQAEKQQINLTISPWQTNVQVYCDIGKLDRVLTNLIENALRHTSAQGEVRLEVNDVDASQCHLSINDNGTGIKKEEIAYIFEPRYRASNAVNNEHKHNGLGLAITKRLLQLLNIEIKVTSRLGKGTRFSFNLRKAQN